MPIDIVDAAKPILSRQIRALPTGALGGELFRLCATTLETDNKKGIWLLRPHEHNTAHHDHKRMIPFGPKAQAVLRPFLIGRPINAYLFIPAEADIELRAARARKRRTFLHCGNSAARRNCSKRFTSPFVSTRKDSAPRNEMDKV